MKITRFDRLLERFADWYYKESPSYWLIKFNKNESFVGKTLKRGVENEDN